MLTKTKKDVKYLLQYLLYSLIPLVVLIFTKQFSNIGELFYTYFFLVGLIYLFPLSLFIFTASIALSETGIVFKTLWIEREIAFTDIDCFTNNDGTWGGVFSLSDTRITLYLKNGKKMSLSPQAIELFRDELASRQIPLCTEASNDKA